MESAMTDWLGVVDRYYLSDFIESGGSAFKLLLTRGDEGVPVVLDEIRALAKCRGYVYARVSAAETRMLRIERTSRRYCSAQRMIRSKCFSPSKTCVMTWPPIAA